MTKCWNELKDKKKKLKKILYTIHWSKNIGNQKVLLGRSQIHFILGFCFGDPSSNSEDKDAKDDYDGSGDESLSVTLTGWWAIMEPIKCGKSSLAFAPRILKAAWS
jgi:hypothetical protein